MPTSTAPDLRVGGPYMNPKKAAEYLDLDVGTLANWRASGMQEGPPYYKLGTGRTAPVRYAQPDLDAWMATNYGPGYGAQKDKVIA